MFPFVELGKKLGICFFGELGTPKEFYFIYKNIKEKDSYLLLDGEGNFSFIGEIERLGGVNSRIYSIIEHSQKRI